MTAEEAFERMMRAIAAHIPMGVSVGKVVKVDAGARTCDVEREMLPDLLDVRLNAVMQQKDGVTLWPAVGSYVLAALVERSATDAYLLATSRLERVTVEIGGSAIEARDGEISVNGGAAGGLVRIDPLADRLDRIAETLDALLESYKAHTHTCAEPGSATSPIVATLAAGATGKTDRDALQNKKVTHG